MKTLRRIGRIILIPGIILLALLLTLMIIIQLPAVQTKLGQYAVTKLNEEFGTEMNVERIRIDFLGDVNLYGVSAIDNHQLKFIDIDRIRVKLSFLGLLRNPDKITIKQLTLHQPKIQVITYENDSTSNFIRLIDSFSSDKEKEESNFVLRGNILIQNGNLLIQNQNLEDYRQNWVEARNLNITIDNFKLENDDIWGDIVALNFHGKRKGEDYVLKDFSGKVHYSEQEIRVEQLNVETADSHLNGHIVLFYDRSEDLGDFEDKVNWDLYLAQGSKVNFKDIRYFADDFDNNNSVDIIGKVTGTLNNMKFNDLQLSDDGNFIATDALLISDMTKGENLQITSNSLKIKTSYQNLTQLLPTFISEYIPDFLTRFGTMDYNGNFNLDSDHIDVNGRAITALGMADMKVKLEDYSNHLKYSGTLMADNLDLKKISEVDELGFVKGTLHFNGQGTDLKYLKINADSKLDYLELLGKRFHNVTVDGVLDKQRFNGLLSVSDSQFNGNYDGIFDFSKKPYKLNFKSDIRHINLDYMGLTKNMNARVSSQVSGDFTFSNLDDFLGEIVLRNLHFESKNDKVDLNYAQLNSTIRDDGKCLELNIPGYLNGEINGNFKLGQLPDAIMNSVGENALVNYKKKKVDKNQAFNFHFAVEQDLFNFFDPRIQIAPGTLLDGAINTTENRLIADLKTTQIGFGEFTAFNPVVNVDTSKEIKSIFIQTDSLNLQNTMLYNLSMHTDPHPDSLFIKTDFQMSREFPVDFDLTLYQTTDSDKNLIFGFAPSTIEIDQNIWHLNPENNKDSNRAIVNFDKNYYELQKLSLVSDDQSLFLDGYYANNADFKVNANLENLKLSKIIPGYVLGDLKVDGIANGNIDIIRTKEELKPLMAVKIDELSIGEYELGVLNANAEYNVSEKVFDLNIALEQAQMQSLLIAGYIDNKPEKPVMNVVANADELQLKFLGNFLSAAMSNIRGLASGEVRFTGPVDSPDFSGTLSIEDLGFKVDFLNVDYHFSGVNTVPVFKESGGQGYIGLDDVVFADSKYGTMGEVSGQILFRDFATWFLNLSFNTNNLLVMDTGPKQNELFYGKVFGQGAFELFGPPETLDISANAIINEGTEFTINTGATKVESKNSLVRFIPEAEESVEKKQEGPKGITIDLNVTADPKSTVNLIFDPVSGDMVTANGSTRDMRFRMNRAGSISLEGVYTLESGEYKFRQVPFFTRNFAIRPGSFVSFDGGGPFDATMEITANYQRTVSNVGEFLGAGYSQNYDVVLGILISESLRNPKMDFTLNIPKGGTDVQSLLDYKFNMDPDDKMIQFGSILLFGQFMTNTESVFTGDAVSTGAGIAIRQLGGIINAMMDLEGVTLITDFVAGSQMSGTTDIFKQGVAVKLNSRWTINGMVGVPVGDNYNNITTTGELEAEWDVSQMNDKSIVVDFFTRPADFGIQNFGGSGNYQSFGAGITYKRSFDRFSEIFKKPKSNTPILPLSSEPFENPAQDSIPKQENKESETPKDSLPEKPIGQNKPLKKERKTNSLVRFK
ncbi:MAG: translocation/assembly module TamB domain-containing protein [Weeksellaceae bacterium]